MFTAFRGDEQALFRRLGATGAFPTGAAGARTSSRSSGRTTPTTRPTSGCTATSPTTRPTTRPPGTSTPPPPSRCTTTPRPPASPTGVIGSNGRRLPLGTNLTYLSFYTPLELEPLDARRRPAAAVLGEDAQLEFGYHVYSMYISIPSGATVTLQLHLSGTLASSVVVPAALGGAADGQRRPVDVTLRPTTPVAGLVGQRALSAQQRGGSVDRAAAAR